MLVPNLLLPYQDRGAYRRALPGSTTSRTGIHVASSTQMTDHPALEEQRQGHSRSGNRPPHPECRPHLALWHHKSYLGLSVFHVHNHPLHLSPPACSLDPAVHHPPLLTPSLCSNQQPSPFRRTGEVWCCNTMNNKPFRGGAPWGLDQLQHHHLVVLLGSPHPGPRDIEGLLGASSCPIPS